MRLGVRLSFLWSNICQPQLFVIIISCEYAKKMTVKDLELAREKLNPNNLEAGLPGRESHRDSLYNFIYDRLKIRQTTEAKRAKVEAGEVADIKRRHLNKTMFVCGVPGTGKTATTMYVLDKLANVNTKKSTVLHPFQSIYINGQHLSTPNKVFTEILHQITGETWSSERAQEKLDKIFMRGSNDKELVEKKTTTTRKASKRKAVPNGYFVLVIDEMDLLYTEKRQSIFYSLFDWPTSYDSRLILIAIANAMNLPEKFMRGRISSRMGWEKLVFESYNSTCLENILKTRLGVGLLNKCFDKGAIVISTKRIGNANGDARRILDTCRLAIDKAICDGLPKVTASLINEVGFQNLDRQRSDYVMTCPPLQLMVLKCILHESAKVGDENVNAFGVYRQLTALMKKHKPFEKYSLGYEEYETIVNTLAGINFIYLEDDKPLLLRKLYIKSNDALNDLIRSQEIQI